MISDWLLGRYTPGQGRVPELGEHLRQSRQSMNDYQIVIDGPQFREQFCILALRCGLGAVAVEVKVTRPMLSDVLIARKVTVRFVPAVREHGDDFAIEVFRTDFSEYNFCHSDI